MIDHHLCGDGPTVLLIPGMEGHHRFWHAQWDTLATRFRVVSCSYPIRGPGLGSRVADYAEAMLQLADHLDARHFAVIGESFGGLIAQQVPHPYTIGGWHQRSCQRLQGARPDRSDHCGSLTRGPA